MKIRYKLKSIKEDFIVNEVSLLPFFCSSGESEFTYIVLKKAGMTTFDAIGIMKEFYNLEFDNIVAEGLKDEDGITTQLISIKKILLRKDVIKFNGLFKSNEYYLKIIEIKGYGKQPLISRSLHGNAFEIVIRNISKQVAEKFSDFCSKNRHINFINYYDNQRFGIVGGVYNTHLIGKFIVDEDWKRAFEEFRKSKNVELLTMEIPKKITVAYCKEVFKNINPSKISFFISSYESYIWNREVSEYLKRNKLGEEFYFSKIGTLTVPKNNKMNVLNIFSCGGYFFDKDTYTAIKKDKERNLSVGTTVFPLKIEKDDINKSKYKITVSFFLPTGCYATMLIRQIFLKLENYER